MLKYGVDFGLVCLRWCDIEMIVLMLFFVFLCFLFLNFDAKLDSQ